MQTLESRAERFRQFHENNPHVYQKILELAREAKAKGARRFGMRAIWERLRWYYAIETNSGEPYKFSDHFAPFYARLMIRNHPREFAGWLEVRGNRCRLPEGV